MIFPKGGSAERTMSQRGSKHFVEQLKRVGAISNQYNVHCIDGLEGQEPRTTTDQSSSVSLATFRTSEILETKIDV